LERISGADGVVLLMHRAQVVGALAYMAPSDMKTLQMTSGGLSFASGDLSSFGIPGVKGKAGLTTGNNRARMTLSCIQLTCPITPL
jgi:hypothetical protein